MRQDFIRIFAPESSSIAAWTMKEQDFHGLMLLIPCVLLILQSEIPCVHGVTGMALCEMRVRFPSQEVAVRENRTTLNLLSSQETLRPFEDKTLSIYSVEALSSLLHKCRRERNIPLAVRLHTYMQNNDLENHALLGNNLVCMLADIGRMHDAQTIFDRQVHRNDSSWNSLIKGHSRCGEGQHALDLYKKTLGHTAIQLSPSTFVALLKACAETRDVDTGSNVHADIARKGLLERDIFLGTALVDMYAKC
eukprot:c17548_g3_i1 orf=85-834(+)